MSVYKSCSNMFYNSLRYSESIVVGVPLGEDYVKADQ